MSFASSVSIRSIIRTLAPLLALLAGAAIARADVPSDDAESIAAFHQIESDFGMVPRPQSLAALDAFARDHAASPLAPRSLVWRAQLALVDGDFSGAAARYRAVVSRYGTSDQAPFAHRGLGDVAMREGRLDQADREFVLAGAHADPVLRAEVDQKRGLVATLKARHHKGWLALGLFFAVAIFFAVRIIRGAGPIAIPPEAIYALPIVILLAGGARLSDARVVLALSIAATGAMLMIALSGMAAERAPARSVRGLGAHIAIVVVAMAALFYFAAERGGIIDVLKDTFVGTPQ